MNVKLTSKRSGKVILLLCILLPTILAVASLVVDGGFLLDQRQRLQHAADAAATAAAFDLLIDLDNATATATAQELIVVHNQLADADVVVNIPPVSGSFAGQAGHVEVLVAQDKQTYLASLTTGLSSQRVQARAVAGVRDATAGAAIAVLDPDPADLSVGDIDALLGSLEVDDLVTEAIQGSGAIEYLQGVPVVGSIAASLLQSELESLLPQEINTLLNDAVSGISISPLPTLIAGMEVEGIGRLHVDGAIHVNNAWGGVDENGAVVGSAPAPPYALSCMPIIATTRVLATDIRVSGGVDDSEYYGPIDPQAKAPLQANRRPVDDPYESLPIPSLTSDFTNVSAVEHSPADAVRVTLSPLQASTVLGDVLSGLTALLKPLFAPLIEDLEELLTTPTLQPGVYDSITVLAPLGGARFEPGVYVIRSVSPITNMSLCIVGPVQAEGVLFYITDSASFDAASGFPDSTDDSSTPPTNTVSDLLPSTLIAPLLAGGRITALNDAASPFDGMLIFQRPLDRRPIVIEAQQLLGGGDLSGTVYSKWGHLIFVGGNGTYDMRFVTGSLRILTVTDTTLSPTTLLPTASDVFLLE